MLVHLRQHSCLRRYRQCTYGLGRLNAVHADALARFLFAFAADSYSDVEYVYLEKA